MRSRSGALEHYAADTEGHRIATNRAVPILYPELRRKFGNDVTYWDNPVAHIRTEFGFDVLQVASGRYAPDRYQSFIGFQVSRDRAGARVPGYVRHRNEGRVRKCDPGARVLSVHRQRRSFRA